MTTHTSAQGSGGAHLNLKIPLCTGAGVRVAVLDSGVNSAFPALANKRNRVFDCQKKGGNGVSFALLPYEGDADTNGHGSVVQSCLVGVAPDVEVDHYRILDRENQCDGALLCHVLEHVIEQGYEVVNLSLGTKLEKYVPWLVTIMRRAYEKNTAIVAAAVHQGQVLYPARFTSAFSCDAHAHPDPLLLHFQSNSVIEFAAWGVQVPVQGPEHRQYVVSGSSYAAAHLSGLVARAIEALGKGASVLELKLLLKQYATGFESIKCG